MTQTFIPGKDAALEDSIARFQQKLSDLGFNIEEASWLNPVPHVWSVHIRDRDCPLCFTNGKGASKKPRWPPRWVNISSACPPTTSSPISIWASRLPKAISCTTRMRNGSRSLKTTRCRPASSTSACTPSTIRSKS